MIAPALPIMCHPHESHQDLARMWETPATGTYCRDRTPGCHCSCIMNPSPLLPLKDRRQRAIEREQQEKVNEEKKARVKTKEGRQRKTSAKENQRMNLQVPLLLSDQKRAAKTKNTIRIMPEKKHSLSVKCVHSFIYLFLQPNSSQKSLSKSTRYWFHSAVHLWSKYNSYHCLM